MPRREQLARLIAAIALGAIALPQASQAQDVVQLEGGGSSGAGGYGAALHYWTDNFGAGWVGVGFRERLQLAFLSQIAVAGDSLAAGYAYQRLPLAGDQTGGMPLATQGLTWQHDAFGSAWSAFAGVAGLGAGAPFVSSTQANQPLALLRVDQRVAPTVRVVALAAASRRQTLLPGVVYRPARSSYSIALTGGVGANAPYGSARWRYESAKLRADAEWSEFRSDFRRVDAPSTTGLAEPYRENVSATYELWRGLRVTAGRQSYLVQPSATLPGGRAVVDRVIAGGELWTWAYNAGVFRSRGNDGERSLSTFSRVELGRARRIGGGASFYTTDARDHAPERTLSLELRERLGLDAELLQVVTRSSSGTSIAAGGRVDFGLVAVNVDYSTLYVPLRRPDPFLRTISVSLSVRRANATTSVSTLVDPEGHVSYSATGSTYLYMGDEVASAQPVVIRLRQYLVRGEVRDTAGVPIEGAALRIGGELVVTDSRGEFLVRTDRAEPLALVVALDEFIATGRFEVVSSPAQVTPSSDERAAPVAIVLRRVRRTQR